MWNNAASGLVPGIAPDTPRPTAGTPRSLLSSPAAVAPAELDERPSEPPLILQALELFEAEP